MRLGTLGAPNQLDTSRDVPPLIAPAELQHRSITPMQLEEVVRLHQHVAEFCERDAAVEPRLHRFFLQHDIHAEVLPDIAQEVHQALLHEPIGVVQHQGRRRPIEVEEPRHLVAHALQILPDLLFREEGPLAGLTARIADQPGAAPHQRDRAMPRELEVSQQHDRHEIAELQAGRGRIESDVPREEASLE